MRRDLAAAVAALVRRRAAPEAVVLAYHDVVARGATGYTVTARALRGHVRLVRSLGLRLVGVRELAERAATGAPTAGLAALAFDDGLIGVHRHALDVLAEEGAPATVFAVSRVWGAEPEWWPGSARTMDRTEMLEARAAGLTIDAHTRTHPSLPACDDAALAAEVAGCRADLEDLTGEPVRTLAYPQGHHDARVRAAARDAGYDAAFTFLNGRIQPGDDPLRLPRLTMTATHTPLRLAYHLARPAASWPDHQVDAVAAVR